MAREAAEEGGAPATETKDDSTGDARAMAREAAEEEAPSDTGSDDNTGDARAMAREAAESDEGEEEPAKETAEKPAEETVDAEKGKEGTTTDEAKDVTPEKVEEARQRFFEKEEAKKYRNEAFLAMDDWWDKHGDESFISKEEAREWVKSKAEEYAKGKMAGDMEDIDPEEIEEWFSNVDKAAKQWYDDAVDEGMDPAEAKKKAWEEGAKVVEEMDEFESDKKELTGDPERNKERSEKFISVLNGAGDFINGLGKVGEYINKGLDIAKGVLGAMLNPSPLGLNEAQTMLTATAEAMNVADELVKGFVAKGNEKIGKHIVNNMTASMGKIIHDNFGDKDLSQMTPQELDQFTDQLTREWQPFLNRLDMIGADNPAGAQLAEKFKSTFGLIEKQAKKNRFNAGQEKKRAQEDIRHEKRAMEQMKAATIEELIDAAREQHKNLQQADPKAAKTMEMVDYLFGKNAIDTPPDQYSYNTWYDQKLYTESIDANGNLTRVPTPMATNAMIKHIKDMKESNNPEYVQNAALYDQIYDDLLKKNTVIKEGLLDDASLAKLNNKVNESQPALQRIVGLKDLSQRNYIKKQGLAGAILAGNVPIKVADDIYNAASEDARKYYLLSQQRPLTQEEQNAYTIAKNTQDAMLSIKRAHAFRQSIMNAVKKKGNQPYVDKNGNQKIDPITGDPLTYAEVFDESYINQQVNKFMSIFEHELKDVPMEYNHPSIAANGGNVPRVKNIMRLPSVLGVAIDIQNEMDLPDIIGDPTKPFYKRIGMRDILGSIHELDQSMQSGSKDVQTAVNRVNGQVLAFHTNALKLLKDMKADDATYRAAMIDTLGAMADGIGSIYDLLDNDPNGDMRLQQNVIDPMIEKFKDAFIEAAKANPAMSGGFSAFVDKLDEIKKAIENGDPNTAKLLEEFKDNANKVSRENKENTQNIVDAVRETGGGGAPQSAARIPPSWFDASYGAGPSWDDKYGPSRDPRDWPSDPVQYWNRYNDLMAVLENTPADDVTRARLVNMACQAYINGTFGNIVDNGDGTYSLSGGKQRDGNSLTPSMSIMLDKNGVPKFNGNTLQYRAADGSLKEFDANTYQQMLAGLHNMLNVRGLWQVNTGKDAGSEADMQRVMRVAINLANANQ
jgi:Cobalamin biosynthesis protein CobT (nicotinate-mononucleotide:5, 6-dimethylbenzimidazole phosphoribosyltransferase)